MDTNYYYKQHQKILKDFNMQKELEKKLSAEDKRLNKVRIKFVLLLFEHRSIFKYYCSVVLNFLVRYCSGMANNF